MKSLKEVFDGVTCASLPYTTAIKAVVCGVGEVKKYRNASGEQRQSVTIGLADSSMAVRGVLYDVSKMDTFKVGCTVMLLNSIIKKDAVRSIVLTNRSKILKTGPVAVSESLRKEALEMACPPPAEMVDIKAVHTSPVKTVLTIRGQVVSEEMDRTVKVNGEETTVRSIKLRDATGTCRISLWRDMAKVKTTVGSHLEITNAVVQFYNEEKSLSTTSRSKMEEVETPEISQTVTFIAFEWVDDSFASLTSDDANGEYQEFTISREALAHNLRCELQEVEPSLLRKLPMTAKITTRENEIIEITM
ncbi:uncharacterized protein LOC133174295 [Saccostrea echinata]|uniref:uncharacterized protein LOC133174295 n=1 Tax=Saccostrea echinata TaxID=191078 RepID=UPI002A811A30|nr:uncharacterized protein LOC133174295 [Saccostrea echinata]